jgi:hypothetical protein
MSSPKREFNRADLIDYTEYMISDALRSGVVDPKTALQCFFFALEPDLLRLIREFSGLGPEEREKILNGIHRTRNSAHHGRLRSTSND